MSQLWQPRLSGGIEPILTPKLAPYIVAREARALIEFVEKAIGGKLSFREVDPGGRLVHAEVKIEDGLVMIAGATEVRPPADTPDGHRRGGVKDRWGNEWWFSSPVERPESPLAEFTGFDDPR